MTFSTITVAAGDEYDIQYSKDGYLYGDDNLEWNYLTKVLSVNGNITSPFVAAHLKIQIVSGSIDSVIIHVDGAGYIDGTYTISVLSGSLDIYVTDGAVSNVVVADIGSGQTDGTVDYFPDLPKYGQISANKITNGQITIEGADITGVSDLTVSNLVTTDDLLVGSIELVDNNVTGVSSLTSRYTGSGVCHYK
jgi:hypothetical protein